MEVTFYGVRGSMPSPGPDTLIFGGNTSCVHVELENGDDLILDSGTGIVKLGKKIQQHTKDITILLSHNHWDHIQGFPYFTPIFQTDRKITLIPGAVDFPDKDMILRQMSGSNHPVKFDQLPANIQLKPELALQEKFSVKGIRVTTKKLNHPDGGTAYCLYGDGKKVAYVTDNELNPPYQVRTSWQQWTDFIADADILIHDAQYIDNDMPHKHGWGHSTALQVVQLASEAKVKSVFIISHDPSRTDHELLKLEQQLQTRFSSTLNVAFAREGVVINLGAK